MNVFEISLRGSLILSKPLVRMDYQRSVEAAAPNTLTYQRLGFHLIVQLHDFTKLIELSNESGNE